VTARHAAARRRDPQPAPERPPGDGILEVAFEVGSDETLTRLTVARPNGEVQGRDGYGIELPFEDGSFARVACRNGLPLLPDRGGALREMRRVLAHGGEIEVAVRGSIERNPPFAELADSIERSKGARRAAAVRWLFSMPEPDDLWGVLADAGFDEIRIDVVRTTDQDSLRITTETIVGHARRT
jgi:ubiquinone/menaquinone biosynthesis C-methylase UbiE